MCSFPGRFGHVETRCVTRRFPVHVQDTHTHAHAPHNVLLYFHAYNYTSIRVGVVSSSRIVRVYQLFKSLPHYCYYYYAGNRCQTICTNMNATT